MLTGLREQRGPWGPGRRAEAADAFEAVRVIARAAGVDVRLRAAQQLPWHPADAPRCSSATPRWGTPASCIRRWSNAPACQGTCALELDLDAIPLVATLPAPRISPFPAVFQDVSLVVAADVPAQAVADAVCEGAGDLLEDLQLFDVFTGPQLGEHRKSLTFALRFRAPDRTLTEDDATAARDAAVRRAAEAVGAELRT